MWQELIGVRSITDEERRARLGLRHHLAKPAHDPFTIARDLVGLHSSDPATVFLSVWARMRGFETNQLEQALYTDRTLVRMLGMRRTMFVVPAELASVMDRACTRSFYEREERRFHKLLEDHGIAKDGAGWAARVAQAVLDSLYDRGEATAREITEDVPELGLKMRMNVGKNYEGDVGVSTRILYLLATAGRIVRAQPLGTWVSSQYRWAPTDLWLGQPLAELDESAARSQLVDRWLSCYGPGSFDDIKWWTGWGVRDTRAALEAAGAVEVELESGTGFVHASDTESVREPKTWVALLPGLDSTTMGWKERDWYLGGHQEALFDRNGNGGPTVWVDGRVVGGWAHLDSGEVAVRLLEEIDSAAERTIERRALELSSWMGDARLRTRFPVPLEKELKRLPST